MVLKKMPRPASALSMRALLVTAVSMMVVFSSACGVCSSVAGRTFNLSYTVVDGGCTLDATADTVTFSADGGAGGGRSWSQNGCAVTLDFTAHPVAGVTTTFNQSLELDGQHLDGHAVATLGNGGTCEVGVAGVEAK